MQGTDCLEAFTSEYGLAISDLILDAFIFLMPLPFIGASSIRARSTGVRVHLTKINQGLEAPFDDLSKIAVSGIFLLGAS